MSLAMQVHAAISPSTPLHGSKRLTLHPRLAARQSDGEYHVFSPALRKTIVLSRQDWDFLHALPDAAADGSGPACEQAFSECAATDSTGLDAEARIYLGVRKYLMLGLLIEEMWLQRDEIAALQVASAAASAAAAGLSHLPDPARGVRIDDLAGGGSEAGRSDDFDRAGFESLAE